MDNMLNEFKDYNSIGSANSLYYPKSLYNESYEGFFLFRVMLKKFSFSLEVEHLQKRNHKSRSITIPV